MKRTNISGVLFDFDGTLAPNLDLPDMRRQIIALTRQAQVPEDVFADRYIVEIIDAAHAWLQDAQELTQTSNQQSPPAQAAAYFQNAHQLITDFELAAAATTNPFPGIIDKLAQLRAQGLRLAVVTRNCRAAVLQVFPDLLAHVDVLQARDDTPHLKPDPRHLENALRAISVPASNAAMVGDGALDMHVGRALDMYCVGVLSGSADHASLVAAGAHVILEDALALSF